MLKGTLAPPTKRMRENVRLILKHTKKHGRGPTAEELADLAGVSHQSMRSSLRTMARHDMARAIPSEAVKGGATFVARWVLTKKGEGWK